MNCFYFTRKMFVQVSNKNRIIIINLMDREVVLKPSQKHAHHTTHFHACLAKESGDGSSEIRIGVHCVDDFIVKERLGVAAVHKVHVVPVWNDFAVADPRFDNCLQAFNILKRAAN